MYRSKLTGIRYAAQIKAIKAGSEEKQNTIFGPLLNSDLPEPEKGLPRYMIP